MRYIIAILVAILSVFNTSAQEGDAQSGSLAVAESAAVDNQTLWQSGNQAYIDGDYDKALSLYTAIENRGMYSAKLYYNIANTYFKKGVLGYAILYYNRALAVSPSMEDARYNLEIAEAQTKDKIAVVPEFFLNRWVKSLKSSASCTTWSIISLVFFALALASLLLFLLGGALRFRKVGFYITLLSLLLFVITTAFAVSSRNDIIKREHAVVLSSAISVKSSPDKAATDLFVLHEGTKVKILSEVDGWYEVVIADGKKGWTESNHIEKI